MKYFSTRGGHELLSFEGTVLTGLAPDGGLYIPTHIPSLPHSWRTEWSTLSFTDLATEILSLYISPDEISRAQLRALIDKSYSTFRDPDVTPVKKLGERSYVLELFYGPTYAFKDVALQLLGNLFEFFLARRNARKEAGERMDTLTVVGATSGDTGSAAIYGLRGKSNVSIFILHPKGRVSPIQEAQMTTVTDANVHNIAMRGTFDDCQDIVKSLFADKEFNKRHNLGAVNSINWARILAQTVYYFKAYFDIARQLATERSNSSSSSAFPEDSLHGFQIQFVVPTGNFGDILAGYYAKRMGLPSSRLVIATNANDILYRFFQHGSYDKVDSFTLPSVDHTAAAVAEGGSDGRQGEGAGGVRETLSPAMDILVSSNFERLLWYLAEEAQVGEGREGEEEEERRRRRACETVGEWMRRVRSDGRVTVPTEVLELAKRDFMAERVSDEQTLETIRSYFHSTHSYIADPHTAVGLSAARAVAAQNPPTTLQTILSTAHPAKFSSAVERALSGVPNFDFARDVLPEEFKGLLERERRVVDVPAPSEDLVKEVIERAVGTAVGTYEEHGAGRASV